MGANNADKRSVGAARRRHRLSYALTILIGIIPSVISGLTLENRRLGVFATIIISDTNIEDYQSC